MVIRDPGCESWPEGVFRAPVLRGLDERGRAELAKSGKLLAFDAGAALFEAGDPSDSLFVVVTGNVELWALARGDEAPSLLRTALPGATVGEEALVAGLRRGARAVCAKGTEVAEIPAAILTRAFGRGGDSLLFQREVRALRRELTRDLLKAQAFSRHLTAGELELLLDAVRYESYRSGDFILRQGDQAEHGLFLQSGLVQVQSEREGRVRVHAYLSGGDFFADQEVLAREPYRYSAVAMGDTLGLHVAADVMRALSDRNPSLAKNLRRLNLARRAEKPLGLGGVGSTEHVLKDAYRMQMARSLLAIDQGSCVRCGHCAWACAETHAGVSRLIRSGDKIRVPIQEGLASLLLPNTCQHCEQPACMIDCPTGAIGRDPEGEVFIRESLCTGCGACAKACPWHNIQLAPRRAPREPTKAGPAMHSVLSAQVAVKCDLCRDFEAPACVLVCPTDAVQRLDPSVEFEQVRRLFGSRSQGPEQAAAEAGTARVWGGVPLVASTLLFLLFAALSPTARTLGPGVTLAAGIVAGIGCVVLAAHAILKRKVALWMRPRAGRGLRARRAPERARSLLSPWVRAHQAVGLVTCGAVLWHAELGSGWGASGALLLTLGLSGFAGALGSIAYRVVPARLTRLESRGALPEDLAGERAALRDRLYRLTSGQDVLMKRIVELILLPYSTSIWQSLLLLLSGRDLTQERARLRATIEVRLAGRGAERLAGLDELIRTVVDLRALPLRRLLTAVLQLWLPVHAGLTVALIALLILHVVTRIG